MNILKMPKAVINHTLDVLPNGLQKSDTTVVTPSFWNQNNNGPMKLEWYHAIGSCCLNQPNKEAPAIPCTFSSPAIWVLLPSYALEPPLDVFGAHSRCTRHLAVSELVNYSPQFAIGWNVIVDFEWGGIN